MNSNHRPTDYEVTVFCSISLIQFTSRNRQVAISEYGHLRPALYCAKKYPTSISTVSRGARQATDLVSTLFQQRSNQVLSARAKTGIAHFARPVNTLFYRLIFYQISPSNPLSMLYISTNTGEKIENLDWSDAAGDALSESQEELVLTVPLSPLGSPESLSCAVSVGETSTTKPMRIFRHEASLRTDIF